MVESWYPYLAVFVSPGLGRSACLKLPQDYEEVFMMMRTPRGRQALSDVIGQDVGEISWDDFEKQLIEIEENGVSVVCIADDHYPSYLRFISKPPPLLFYKGNLEHLDKRGVAVVGTRKPSARGAAFARKLAGALVESGIMVASGLARGIDTAAHEGSLRGPGASVGVMGTGMDVPYPKENAALIDELSTKGCVFTEQLMGTNPSRFAFPMRNRLISAVARAVVVVEAGERSGTNITTKWALEQGREVGAVPGFPGDFRSRGVNALLKQGAFLVENVDDILDAVPLLKKTETASPAESESSKRAGADFSPSVTAEAKRLGVDPALLDKVLHELSSSPTDPDTLAVQSGLEVSSLCSLLSALEIAGKIAADNQGCYYII